MPVSLAPLTGLTRPYPCYVGISCHFIQYGTFYVFGGILPDPYWVSRDGGRNLSQRVERPWRQICELGLEIMKLEWPETDKIPDSLCFVALSFRQMHTYTFDHNTMYPKLSHTSINIFPSACLLSHVGSTPPACIIVIAVEAWACLASLSAAQSLHVLSVSSVKHRSHYKPPIST